MANSWGRILLALAVLVSLTGCLAPRASEPPHTYMLMADEIDGQTEGKAGERGEQVLLINLPQAESGFETSKIAYLKRPWEVSYYATNEWADQPARMLLPLLVRALEQTGRWRAVIAMPSPVRADFRLETTGVVVQQEFLQQPSRMRVAMRLQLVDLRDYRAVGTRRFEAAEPAPSENAYGGVIAANRAVAKLLHDAADWVATCVDGDRHARCR